MNRRLALLVALLAVVAAGIYLLARSGGGDDGGARGAAPATTGGAQAGGDDRGVGAEGGGGAKGGGAIGGSAGPAPGGAGGAAQAGAGGAHQGALVAGGDPAERVGSRIYEQEDGTRIRDHRGDGNPDYVRPALPHPSLSPVTPTVTAAVMRQIRPIVLGCLADVPEAAYGREPVMMTRATITIDDAGELTAIDLGASPTDIDASAAARAVACIQDGAPRVRTKVDHPAVESATLAFPIRPLDYR